MTDELTSFHLGCFFMQSLILIGYGFVVLCRIQVSHTKKPLYFYVNLAKKLLGEHGEVELSALGLGKLAASPM